MRDRRELPCEGGSRESLNDDGYSAGKCACSCVYTPKIIEESGQSASGLVVTGQLIPTSAQLPKSRAFGGVWSSRKESNLRRKILDICPQLNLHIPQLLS